MWRAEHLDYPRFLATSQAIESSLLLGSHEWTFYNDACFMGNYTTRLVMTGCFDDEFTCNDGSCVGMSVRCDGKSDCKDAADEDECKALVTSIGYNKLLVPPPVPQRGMLAMNLSIELFEIIHINEIESTIQTKIQINKTWYDSQLTFQNLIKNKPNLMSVSDQESIWFPWIVYENIAGSEKIVSADREDFWRVVLNPEFKFTSGDNTNIHNINLFNGSKNAIEKVQAQRVEWLCDFHMEWYPFDTQSCAMQFINIYDTMEFLPSNVTYSGPRDLRQHFVHDVKICSATIQGSQGVIVEVILSRPIFSSFLTTTLPTLMLIIISQLATSFSGEYLDMVIQVNLTVLLVLATL